MLFAILVLLGIYSLQAQEDQVQPLPIKALKDTIIVPGLPDDLGKEFQTEIDSVSTDTIAPKRNSLLSKIEYKAKDSIKLSQKEQKIYLYNEAEVYYEDTELKAGIIVLDYITNEVYAGRLKDSLGVYTQHPHFKQGTNEVTPDSIRFNFDTEKALIWNSRSSQEAGLGSFGSDAMNVFAKVTKKENDSVYFLYEGKLTTSKDTADPDYYIRIRKAKFVPKKKIIAGFSNMYIADVPTPIALPFAYFPMTTGRTAGLIFPTFGNDPNRGYFLQNGGYYLPIDDYADLRMTGDFYTNGSYGFRMQSAYRVRYKFNGTVRFNYENLVTSQKGFSDYGRNTIFNIQVSHAQDPKSNPNSRFSASVNLGSSNYYTNSLKQQNIPNTQNNTLSSSVSYNKTIPTFPMINFGITATHSQNTRTGNIDMTLPTFTGSVERIFPFAKRDGIKKGAIQNINMQYNVRAENRISTVDSLIFKPQMFKEAKIGARHTIPLNTNFKIAKYFSVSMGGTYEDVWTAKTFNQRYDEAINGVVRDTVSGFDRYNRYNLSTSIGTTVYGTFNRGEHRKVQAFRHVMRPSISYSWAPSFDQFYDTYERDDELVDYSRFEGTLYGAPSLNKSSAISFSLQNTLEAKVRDRDSTATEAKKISILKSLNFSTGYNFQADEFKLQPVSVSGGTSILDNKMSINFSGSLDPYALDNAGNRVDEWNINNGGSLFRLTRASMNISYSITSDIFSKEKQDEQNKEARDYVAQSGGRDDDLFGKAENFSERQYKDDKGGDVDNPVYGTKMPWDLRFAYAATYSNARRQNEISNNSLMFSGNIQLSPRWSVGVSSGYDFVNKGFTLTQFRFARDLKSFRMDFSWTPFGTYERWYFFLGIKSSILQDIKWESRSQPPVSIQ
ncbi:putative LPS assembly protein LptD [Sediminicola luteus]|uniref:putative LPS assembly protein LptD n=1 Tax=Sediminicola luteus TaxID=319238 RepID=UPI001FED045E|nr:putative LPS assembly protein LptD [Sediminicola luteus]